MGCHPLLWDLPDPGVEPEASASPSLAGEFLTTEPPEKTARHCTAYIMCVEQKNRLSKSTERDLRAREMSYVSLQMYPQEFLTQWFVLGALPGSLEDKR